MRQPTLEEIEDRIREGFEALGDYLKWHDELMATYRTYMEVEQQDNDASVGEDLV
jgi:hypothetical protein